MLTRHDNMPNTKDLGHTVLNKKFPIYISAVNIVSLLEGPFWPLGSFEQSFVEV